MIVVLFQPQIPQNSGNVVRSCAVTGTDLILVPPFGFSLSNRWLKRAGLDYWEGVNVQIVENLEVWLDATSSPFYFFSSHAKKLYTDVNYTSDSILIFGSETSGLPSHYVEKYPDRFVTIPMLPESRCLNLATSVGIGLFEAIRQVGIRPKASHLT